MTAPFYVSPEQFMKDRADFARKGIARGRSVVAVQYADGILFVSENPSQALHKVSEIYDRIAFAAVGAGLIEQQLNMAAAEAKGAGNTDAIAAFLAIRNRPGPGMWFVALTSAFFALNMGGSWLEQTLKDMAAGSTLEGTESLPDGSSVRTLRTEKGIQLREVTPKGGEPTYSLVAQAGTEMRFNDLTEAAFDEGKRASFSGKTAIMEGRFQPLGDKEFTLFRQKMTCCGPDAVMLKVRIIAPQSVAGFNYFDWVRVKGVVEFIRAPGSGRYVPVLRLLDISDIERIPKDKIKNEYEF